MPCGDPRPREDGFLTAVEIAEKERLDKLKEQEQLRVQSLRRQLVAGDPHPGNTIASDETVFQSLDSRLTSAVIWGWTLCSSFTSHKKFVYLTSMYYNIFLVDATKPALHLQWAVPTPWCLVAPWLPSILVWFRAKFPHCFWHLVLGQILPCIDTTRKSEPYDELSKSSHPRQRQPGVVLQHWWATLVFFW